MQKGLQNIFRADHKSLKTFKYTPEKIREIAGNVSSIKQQTESLRDMHHKRDKSAVSLKEVSMVFKRDLTPN